MSEAAATYHHAGPRPFKQRGQYVQETRHDYAAIRRTARHDENLSIQAYRLFEDVCDLAAKDGYCFASQKYFAERYKVSKRSVIRWEQELIEAGYVVQGEDENDRRRRTLTPFGTPIGDTARHLDRRHGVSSNGEIGDIERQEIGDIERQTPRVYISPRGERETRARSADDRGPKEQTEDPRRHPAVKAYREISGSAQMADLFAAKIVATVGDAPERVEKWIEVVAVWTNTPRWNERNVSKMLSAFEEEVSTPVNSPARKGARGEAAAPGLDVLGDPVERSVRDAAVSAYDLDAAAFYAAGKDWRGEPLYKLRAEVLATLTETAR